MDYQAAMRGVYRFMNISAGSNPRCIKYALQNEENQLRRRDSTDCIFPQNLAPVLQTPLFARQPKYDQWQIWHVIGKPNNVSAVNAFGSTLLHQLKSRLLSNPRHGAFVDSCTHHCTSCSSPGEDTWHGDTVRSTGATRSTAHGLTASDTFARWLAREEAVHRQAQAQVQGQAPPAGHSAASGASGEEAAVFAMQDHLYPCSECCLCHA